MKARSVVFTHTQHPVSIFGLPPLMVGLSTAAAVVVFLLTVFLGAIAVSMVAFGIAEAVGIWFAYRVGRSDRHAETLFVTSLAFWGSSSRRWLLAGAAPGLRSREDRS